MDGRFKRLSGVESRLKGLLECRAMQLGRLEQCNLLQSRLQQCNLLQTRAIQPCINRGINPGSCHESVKFQTCEVMALGLWQHF